VVLRVERPPRRREPSSGRRYTILRLETTGGLVGYGEGGPASAAEILEARTAAVGRRVNETEFIRRHLEDSGTNPKQHRSHGDQKNAAAAIIKDGKIEAAVEEAKLTRRPEPGRLPEAAIAACIIVMKFWMIVAEALIARL